MIEKKKQQLLYLTLILMMGFYASVDVAEGVDTASRVIVENKLMTVDLNSIALNEVLEKIKKQSGISYRGDKETLNEKITIIFEQLPMDVGLKRIVGRFNYCLMYDSSGSPADIFIIGKKDTKSGNKSETISAKSDISSVKDLEKEAKETKEEISTPETKPTPQLQSANLGTPETIKIPKESISANSNINYRFPLKLRRYETRDVVDYRD